MLLRKNPDKKVFVHCRLGDDRTAMMIASYRMSQQGWSAEKAKSEMEKFGFSFAHRDLICPGLSSYEEKFPQHFYTSPAFGICVRRLALRPLSPDESANLTNRAFGTIGLATRCSGASCRSIPGHTPWAFSGRVGVGSGVLTEEFFVTLQHARLGQRRLY